MSVGREGTPGQTSPPIGSPAPVAALTRADSLLIHIGGRVQWGKDDNDYIEWSVNPKFDSDLQIIFGLGDRAEQVARVAHALAAKARKGQLEATSI